MKPALQTWIKWPLLFLLATMLGFFFASQSYLSYLSRGYEANFLGSLLSQAFASSFRPSM